MLKNINQTAATTVTNIDEKMEQMNAIDVRADSIFEIKGCGVIGEQYRKLPDHVRIEWTPYSEQGPMYGEPCITLEKGKAYAVETNHYVTIAKDECGLLIGRSTLNRSGVQLWSCLFDSGFHGYIGGVFYPHNDIVLFKGTRIGQFLVFSAETRKMYDGIYNQTNKG